MEAVADFSGYATKAGLKCSDGRTINAEAFKHMDGVKVPLVWQHGHDKPENVLGHGILEARDDGMYIHGFFNGTSQGRTALGLVQHDDINSLSIYANQLVEKSKTVLHGMIKEVSLVLSGANPGALIDYVRIAHSSDPDDIETLEDEAIIFTGLTLAHSDESEEEPEPEEEPAAEEVAPEEPAKEVVSEEPVVQHAAGDETVQDIYDSLSAKQKDVVNFMIGSALESADSMAQSDISEGNLTHQEGTEKMNVFEKNNKEPEGITLSHSDIRGIVEQGKALGSLKAAVEEFALQHSITDIELMFPEAKFVSNQPELITRRVEWVANVIGAVKKSPFSRIKSLTADLTAEDARAKGYVKGNLKKEEIIKLLRRITTPTTIYKKQKLDRDDIIDIVDFDVVMWLKWEMRYMLEEEIARAILIGDGREPDDDDKIDEDKLRPIAYDDDMYTYKVNVSSGLTANQFNEAIIRARRYFKGTGTPTLYTTDEVLTDMFLEKDLQGQRVYKTEQELAAALRVKEIVVVEVMEDSPEIKCIITNLADYTVGADKGGEISLFDDFDIDYNQYKYLIETRASGALTKPHSAIVIRVSPGNVVTPTTPGYNTTTHVLTVPSQTGVKFYNVTDEDNPVLLSSGNQTLTSTMDVEARPDTGYSFPHGTDDDWVFSV